MLSCYRPEENTACCPAHYLKYSYEIRYITKIKNSIGEEISLEELVEQYFSNPEDYFEEESQKKEENDEPNKKKEIEPENETPQKKYNREQKEIQGWG